jgi:hypothetical protein
MGLWYVDRPPSREEEAKPGELELQERLKGLDRAAYAAVSARRLQFDNLVWQVPVVSMTAQAFLFTISLSSGSHTYSRLVAAGLGAVAAFLSMHLVSRDRQAEIADARWLRAYELANFGVALHGPEWQRMRAEWTVGWFLSRLRGYPVWMTGFALFGFASLVTFVLALAHPHSF